MYEQNEPQYVLPNSTLAIISLVAGILGFTLFPFIASIVAVWTGYEARKETRSVPPRASGDGMATAGIIMGWIQIGLTVISICCMVIYFVAIAGWVGTEALQSY
jgi:magnesium-transporting ATPase (P-type)